jgi:hypothetical protein
MAQYTINASHCSVFGMDVHARSVVVRGLDRSSGETKTKRFVGTSVASVLDTYLLNKPFEYRDNVELMIGFSTKGELLEMFFEKNAETSVMGQRGTGQLSHSPRHTNNKRPAKRAGLLKDSPSKWDTCPVP